MSLNNFKVLLIQQALLSLGIDPGPLDGLWGAKTDAAFVRSGKGKTWLIQLALKNAGVAFGEHDGSWGPKTEAGVARAYNAAWKPTHVATAAELMLEIARGEVGVREVGNNGGTRVREYQAATWLPVGAWPWCAAFVCWVFREAQKVSMDDIKRPETAGAWDFENWALAAGPKVKLIKPIGQEVVRGGDIVVFTFSHIGFAAETTSSSAVKTIEGNTNAGGSREGDGVYLRTHTRSQIRSIIRISA